MKAQNDFFGDMLDVNDRQAQTVWRACFPVAAKARDGDVILSVPFKMFTPGFYTGVFEGMGDEPEKTYDIRLRLYGDETIRLTVAFEGEALDDADNAMLDLAPVLQIQPLTVTETHDGWDVVDDHGCLRARFSRSVASSRPWREGLSPMLADTFRCELFPDGNLGVPFMAWDQFVYGQAQSFPLAFVERESGSAALYSLHAGPEEAFAGTGERFSKVDLAGRTLLLENTDALGVNNRRCYKNIPFFLSNRPYGVFMNTSHHVRLSLADVSTRAVQALIEEPVIDLFVVGGGSLERVLFNYRSLTGFPQPLPLWSYGTWMSRMTYFSADEVREIGRRMRDGGFPCDVLHLDTGWFAKDWVCEWLFSETAFPDPEAFMAEMREQGFRITLWQTPTIGAGNCRLEEAKANRYLAPLRDQEHDGDDGSGSDFSGQAFAGQIDFSNPEAVTWYQGMLENLLRKGASAIKTDFGERIDMDADYMNMSSDRLHNLYALLYQKAAYEITKAVTGDGIIWARSAWAGSQRYPLHWGGDCACSWDGMAGSLRGGLQIGLSGFGFWSHDVPGFHGVPDFMNTWPDDDLYVRWTQFGVFTSHLRYHGTSPREPYEYPRVADIVRQWLQLRYALIPYFLKQQERTVSSGFPVLRALILHHEKDRAAWMTDDEFYCGDDFLVAPVMNSENRRDVYLPEGQWVDFWSGEQFVGPTTLESLEVPLDRMPVYVRDGAVIPVYPTPVQTTAEMDLAQTVTVPIDDSFSGIGATCLDWIFSGNPK